MQYQSRFCPYFIILSNNLNWTHHSENTLKLKKRDAFYVKFGDDIGRTNFLSSVLNLVTVKRVTNSSFLFQRKTFCNEEMSSTNIWYEEKFRFERNLFNIFPDISCLHLKAATFEYAPAVIIDNSKIGNERYLGPDVRVLTKLYTKIVVWYK